MPSDDEAYDAREGEKTITDQARYIAQLEDTLNAFDGMLIAVAVISQSANTIMDFRDEHHDVLSRAIGAALRRKDDNAR